MSVLSSPFYGVDTSCRCPFRQGVETFYKVAGSSGHGAGRCVRKPVSRGEEYREGTIGRFMDGLSIVLTGRQGMRLIENLIPLAGGEIHDTKPAE